MPANLIVISILQTKLAENTLKWMKKRKHREEEKKNWNVEREWRAHQIQIHDIRIVIHKWRAKETNLIKFIVIPLFPSIRLIFIAKCINATQYYASECFLASFLFHRRRHRIVIVHSFLALWSYFGYSECHFQHLFYLHCFYSFHSFACQLLFDSLLCLFFFFLVFFLLSLFSDVCFFLCD